jgi:hypothetical protein
MNDIMCASPAGTFWKVAGLDVAAARQAALLDLAASAAAQTSGWSKTMPHRWMGFQHFHHQGAVTAADIDEHIDAAEVIGLHRARCRFAAFEVIAF